MGDSTPVPASESIPEIEIDYATLLEGVDANFKPYSRHVGTIFDYLVTELVQYGPTSSESCANIARAREVCISATYKAACYMVSRGMVDHEWDEFPHECRCIPCLAAALQLRLKFDYEYDRNHIREQIQQRAQQEAERQRLAAAAAHDKEIRQKESRERRGSVYLLRSGGRFKIGITTNLNQRLSQLRSQQSPFPIELIHAVNGPDYYRFEQHLHQLFAPARVHGEWFDLDPDQVAAVIEAMNEWAASNAPSVEVGARDGVD